MLSAFCSALEQSVGHVSSRGNGMEIPDALRLLDKIDLAGKVISGDAIFCQKTIASKIVAKGGDYVLPVKRNQKALLEEIETAFREPVFPPPSEAQEPADLGHGRTDQRSIALLPAEALSEQMRAASPTVRAIACLTRRRDHVRAGCVIKAEQETTFLISSLNAPTPEAILRFNRRHWSIEAMHRYKDACLGEDGYTNRLGHAPRNVFTLTSAVRTLLKRIHASSTTAIEIMQDSRSKPFA